MNYADDVAEKSPEPLTNELDMIEKVLAEQGTLLSRIERSLFGAEPQDSISAGRNADDGLLARLSRTTSRLHAVTGRLGRISGALGGRDPSEYSNANIEEQMMQAAKAGAIGQAIGKVR